MPTVLVVDDSEVDRRIAGGLVEESVDARVVFAKEGQEAIPQIEQHAPDLVLTDLMMPGMNGLQLVDLIKSDYPRIPVILMTAQGSEEIAAEALQRGAASYVPKKRLADDLVQTVRRVLVSRREDRENSRLFHHMTDDESNFVLRNDLGLIRDLVCHLQQLLRCLPLGDETERLRVGIALEEAIENAYYHGNLEVGASLKNVDHDQYAELAEQRRLESPYCDRRIHVHVKMTRDEARYVVRDEGPGFDTSTLPSAIENESMQSGRRGVILIRSIMDEVSYNDLGNELTMTKRRVAETEDADGLDELDD